MKEKVYSVNNYWDMTIIEGIADYNGRAFYYTNIFSEEQDDWTDEFLLTPLFDDIFTLGKINWDYWLHWLKTCTITKIPHPVNYAQERNTKSFEELATTDTDIEEWKKAEQNYQNQLIFDNYLQSQIPIIKAKGLFCGKIDGTDTSVEWAESKISEEAIKILHSSNVKSATDILLYLSFNFDDWRSVQNECISLIADKKIYEDIRRLAVTSLGHLIRIHSTIDNEKVIPFLQSQMQQDEEIAGTIADTLKDIELFTKS